MRILENSFRSSAIGGWFLLLFCISLWSCLYAWFKQIFKVEESIILLVIAMCLIMVIIAALIGKSYIIALTVIAVIYGWVIDFILGLVIISILAFLLSLGISFLYKMALSYYNKPPFLHDETAANANKNITKIILYIVLTSGIYALFFVPLISNSNGSYAWFPMQTMNSSVFPLDLILDYFTTSLLAALISILFVGHNRIYNMLGLIVFNLIYFLCTGHYESSPMLTAINSVPIIIAGLIIIAYYGNNNKISFVKVIKYIVKGEWMKNNIGK